MRIIAGENKGLRLTPIGAADAKNALRPTSDRVRESLFSMLASRGRPAEGDRVLDLFCGTGALGLEALSRGAAHCTFVDIGRKALGLTRKNIALTQREGQATVLNADATKDLPGGPFDLVFLDPPYGRNLATPVLEQIAGKIAPQGIIVVEEGKQVDYPPTLGPIAQKRFGDTHIQLLAPKL